MKNCVLREEKKDKNPQNCRTKENYARFKDADTRLRQVLVEEELKKGEREQNRETDRERACERTADPLQP